jgi:hypothetical protein
MLTLTESLPVRCSITAERIKQSLHRMLDLGEWLELFEHVVRIAIVEEPRLRDDSVWDRNQNDVGKF